MKYLAISLFAVSLLWAHGAQASSPLARLGESIKAPIEIEAGESPRMNVIFNHTSHIGKGFGCAQCHHERVEGTSYVSCSTEGCHETPGAHDDDTMSMFAAFHSKDNTRSCYGCHTSLREENPEKYSAFIGCRPCHISPQARAEAEAAK